MKNLWNRHLTAFSFAILASNQATIFMNANAADLPVGPTDNFWSGLECYEEKNPYSPHQVIAPVTDRIPGARLFLATGYNSLLRRTVTDHFFVRSATYRENTADIWMETHRQQVNLKVFFQAPSIRAPFNFYPAQFKITQGAPNTLSGIEKKKLACRILAVMPGLDCSDPKNLGKICHDTSGVGRFGKCEVISNEGGRLPLTGCKAR